MPWVKSYWVHMAMMRQSRTVHPPPGGGSESYGYADWQYDSRTGEYAYMQVIGPDPLADAEVLYRSGDVVILRRLRAPPALTWRCGADPAGWHRRPACASRVASTG